MQLNSSKPIAGLLAMLFVFYLIYILITSDPLERMNRMCSPLTRWPARVFVSGTRIFAPKYADSMQIHFDHGFYTCRRWVWGALYEQDYEKEKAEEAAQQRPHAASVTVVTPATSAGGAAQ